MREVKMDENENMSHVYVVIVPAKTGQVCLSQDGSINILDPAAAPALTEALRAPEIVILDPADVPALIKKLQAAAREAGDE